MAKRKPISKKIRFEVFKRDNFTCQYCGRKAPDVELEIDHLKPVAKGGDNNMLNLITSCFECNRGKKDRKLDDNSIVEKQRKELEYLQDRRNRLNMLLKWSAELEDVERQEMDAYLSFIMKLFPMECDGKLIREGMKKAEFKKCIETYGAEEVVKGMRIAKSDYFDRKCDSIGDKAAFLDAMEMLPRILATRKKCKEDPSLFLKNKARAYCRKKFGEVTEYFVDISNSFIRSDVDLDYFISVLRDFDDLDEATMEIEITYAQAWLEYQEYRKGEQDGGKKDS